MALAAEKCAPCHGEEGKLSNDEIESLLKDMRDWQGLEMNAKLFKDFTFRNFAQALDFVNKVGALAERENHHPDISFGWGYAEIVLTTHAAKGLTRNDFILAAKIDELAQSQ